MSKENETINKIKKLVGLSVDEVTDEVKDVKEETVLAEDVTEEVMKDKPMEEAVKYVTEQQLSEVKNELFSMIKALIDENKKEMKEVPQELSKQELSKQEEVKVELEEVKEIVHSPENEVEKEKVDLSGVNFAAMTPLERIQFKLNK